MAGKRRAGEGAPRDVGRGRPAQGSEREVDVGRDPIVKRSIAILSSQDTLLDEQGRRTGLGLSALVREYVRHFAADLEAVLLGGRPAQEAKGERGVAALSPALRDVVLATADALGTSPAALVEQLVEEGLPAAVDRARQRQERLRELGGSLGAGPRQPKQQERKHKDTTT